MNLLLFRVMQAFALIEISLRQNRSRIATHRGATAAAASSISIPSLRYNRQRHIARTEMMERMTTGSNDGDRKLPTLSTEPKKQPPQPQPQPSEKAEKLTIDDVKCSTRTDSLKMNTGLLPFPENLMSLLDNGVVSDIIRWLPDGDAFCLKPALFAERVLDKYFQGTKFESFTRKLNRWYVH